MYTDMYLIYWVQSWCLDHSSHQQVLISVAHPVILLSFLILELFELTWSETKPKLLYLTWKLEVPQCYRTVSCTCSSPAGLPLCRSETPAWTRLPPWTSCSRRIPRPPASAGAATGRPAAVRRRSTDTCRSPTWMDPPRLLFCRIAAGVSERERRCKWCGGTDTLRDSLCAQGLIEESKLTFYTYIYTLSIYLYMHIKKMASDLSKSGRRSIGN